MLLFYYIKGPGSCLSGMLDFELSDLQDY